MESPCENLDPHLSISATIRRPIARRGAVRRLAATFGLRRGPVECLYDRFNIPIHRGQIIAVTGPSGGGKSVLLRKAARRFSPTIRLPLEPLSQDSRPVIDAVGASALPRRAGGRTAAAGRREVRRRLDMLSRCGLAEAVALITPACRLSGGQLFRAALAKALLQAQDHVDRLTLVVADEFAGCLDDATATILCRQIRKRVAGSNVCLLLATPHDRLLACLQPDVTVFKPLGAAARIVEGEGWTGFNAAPPPEEWPIERGTIRDYRRLAAFHYVAGPPATHKRVYVIRSPRGGVCGGDVAAVLVVSPPLLTVRGLNLATAGRYLSRDRKAALALLNAEMESISRVIVHPIYRGAGLAVRLVRHALATARAPLMEALAAMGRVHPLFDKAGMTGLGLCRGWSAYYNYYLAHTRHDQPVIDWLWDHERRTR